MQLADGMSLSIKFSLKATGDQWWMNTPIPNLTTIPDRCPAGLIDAVFFIRGMTHSGQVNVPRQCDGLAGKIILAIHQLCEIRQLLGGAVYLLSVTLVYHAETKSSCVP